MKRDCSLPDTIFFLPTIKSVNGYQWLSVCVALLVLPSTRMTPYAFKKLGVAGTCVFGNLCTALLTGLLLIIGNLPATELGFAWFVIVMYGGMCVNREPSVSVILPR